MTSRNFFICVALVVSLSALCYARYSDCGSKVGALGDVVVSGCKETDAKCILKRNTNTSLEITFTPNEEITSLKAVVHGKVFGVLIPFSLPNSDACVDSGLQCPLKAGTTYKYIAKLPILSEYPRVTVDVKWELQRENSTEDDVICALIPSKISV